MVMVKLGVDLLKVITDVEAQVLGDNPQRLYALLVNDGDQVVYLSRGIPAVASRGIRINANGGSYEINLTNPWHSSLRAVCAAGLTSTLLVQEN